MEKEDDNKKEEVRHCVICDADRKVSKVENVSDGKQMTLECNHPYGEKKFEVTENLHITENVEYVILKDPVADVKRSNS